jgi:hypothetical protein
MQLPLQPKKIMQLRLRNTIFENQILTVSKGILLRYFYKAFFQIKVPENNLKSSGVEPEPLGCESFHCWSRGCIKMLHNLN